MAGFNISEFSSHISKTGTLQTNKFLVEIPTIKLYIDNAGTNTDLERLVTYRAESVHVPGVSLDVQSVHRYGIGPIEKYPTNVNFTENTITFIDDAQNTVWKYMYDWMNVIFQYSNKNRLNRFGSYTLEYKENYAVDIKIAVFGNDGKQVSSIVLVEAFPTALDDVSLSWSTNSSLFRVSARFSFKTWYEEDYSPFTKTVPYDSLTAATIRENRNEQ